MKSLLMFILMINTAFASNFYVGKVEARKPIHFSQGNGINQATNFETVQEFAVTRGVEGMKKYTKKKWLSPKGRISIIKRRNQVSFTVYLQKLVPDAFYTVWLVRKENSPRGPKANFALGYGSYGPDDTQTLSNQVKINKWGMGAFSRTLETNHSDTQGQVFEGLESWDEIHIAFHADNKGYGDIPGPHHWTQVVIPLR